MQELIDKIANEGVHVGGGIVKLDSFLNHQVEPNSKAYTLNSNVPKKKLKKSRWCGRRDLNPHDLTVNRF